MDDPRLDTWLWSVRACKTRAEAATACRQERVRVNDLPAKPGRAVHAGEVVTVRAGLMTRTLRVLGAPRSRVAAKLVPDYAQDLTPPEEWEKLRRPLVEQVLARAPGSGRPTKRDRRALDRLFGCE